MNLGLTAEPAGTGEENLSEYNLGVVWESPWREFWSSLRDFFFGARPEKDGDVRLDRPLRVDWVRGRLPGRAFLASCLWHAAAVLILILPIWGFLPQAEHTLAPVQIEVTYYPAQDLPRISLPAPAPKASAPAKKRADDAAKPAEQPGADAYHPRQTILSIPVQVTHPRQTLIQPDVPLNAPKVDVQLPNMVQWASAAPPKPQLQLSPAAAAPRLKQRRVRDIAVPEVANNEKSPGPINIAAAPVVNLQPQMPLSAMAAVAQQHQARADSATAPEIGAPSNDPSLHRLIALSAAPGPPAPEVSVPQENLAARISVSPAGKSPGTPGAAGGSSANGGAANGGSASAASNAGGSAAAGSAGVGGVAGNATSLPAAISISGGNPRAGALASGGIAAGRLNLKPAVPDLTPPPRKGSSAARALDPNVPPEKILYGKEVYTLDVNLPNLTSVAGSWVLNFAQLDEGDGPPIRPKGQLAGPVPLQKTDPKYPPELIKQHVEGQVILYAIIGKDGAVRNIQLVHSVESELDKDAMEALAHWKFRPGTRDGAPVDLEAVIYIPFRYRPVE
jgi:TonB family protein